MRMERIIKNTIIIAVGLTGGIVIGLLLAPASGSRTRRRLADDALRVAETAKDIAAKAERTADALAQKVDHYLGREEEVAWRKVREIREGVQRYSRTVVS